MNIFIPRSAIPSATAEIAGFRQVAAKSVLPQVSDGKRLGIKVAPTVVAHAAVTSDHAIALHAGASGAGGREIAEAVRRG